MGDAATPGDASDSGGEDDPFASLLDPSFAEQAVVKEPSAEERARASARSEREAALRRRLAEEAEHEQRLAERDRKAQRSAAKAAKPPRRRSRWITPVVVVALVAVLLWVQNGRSNTSTASSGDAAAPATAPGTTVVQPAARRARNDRPTPQHGATTPLGSPPPVPDPAGPFEVLMDQDLGSGPVTWDPCRPVRYVVNAAGAPPGGQALVDAAIAKVSAATGLHFENAGTTDEGFSKDRADFQPDRYGDRWAPVLILWSTPDTVPDLAGYVVGEARPHPVRADDGGLSYVSGTVVLDADDVAKLMARPGGGDEARAIVQHELGHLVGLGHVADPTQLMYTEGNPRQTNDWGNGDLAGLNLVGKGVCYPDL